MKGTCEQIPFHFFLKFMMLGIAVGNVIDRLELYYKQKDLLTIESEGLGLGTSVHITLPVEVEGTSE